MPPHDAFAKHEVLHTASVLQDTWAEQIIGHHVVDDGGDEELRAAAQAVFDAMYEFYKLCGHKFLDHQPEGVDDAV